MRQRRRAIPALLALLLLSMALASGCATRHYSQEEVELLENYMVAFDALGRPLNPDGDLNGWDLGDQVMTEQHFRNKVYAIADNIRKAKDIKKVVLFIHGGLNNTGSNIDRALHIAPDLLADGIYPIFVAWNSDLFTSYWDNVTQQQERWPIRVAVLPHTYRLASDLVTGLVTVPDRIISYCLSWVSRRTTTKETFAASIALAHRLNETSAVDSKEPHHAGSTSPRDAPQVIIGDFQGSGFTDFCRYRGISGLVQFPVRWASSIFVGSFGKGTWKGMLRRAKLLFNQEIGGKGENKEDNLTNYGLPFLLKELRKVQLQRSPLPERRGQQEHYRLYAIEKSLEVLASLREHLAARDPEVLQHLGNSQETQGDEQARFTPGIAGRLLYRFVIDQNFPSAEDLVDIDHALAVAAAIASITTKETVARDLAQLTGSFRKLLQDAFATPGFQIRLRSSLRGVVADCASKEGKDRFLRSGVEAWWNGELSERYCSGLSDKLLTAVVEQLHVELLKEAKLARRNELTVQLFAHSMGAIVANEILHRSTFHDTPRFKDVVYLAAACSVKSYEEAVIPYLDRHRGYGSKFYNVMLHPRAESTEHMGYGFIPQGSLLVYIDEYLSSPETDRDRTLGQFVNFMPSLNRIPASVRDRVHGKVFSAGDGTDAAATDLEGRQHATTHRGFTPACFWRPEFYWKETR